MVSAQVSQVGVPQGVKVGHACELCPASKGVCHIWCRAGGVKPGSRAGGRGVEPGSSRGKAPGVKIV